MTLQEKLQKSLADMAKKKEAKRLALEQKEEGKAEPEPVPIDKPMAQMSLAE
jgi:hypothetical protein